MDFSKTRACQNKYQRGADTGRVFLDLHPVRRQKGVQREGVKIRKKVQLRKSHDLCPWEDHKQKNEQKINKPFSKGEAG